MQNLIVWLFVGFVAQLVDGSLGMGYGATSTTLLLTAGLSPAVASASVHLAKVGTTFLSGASHASFGNVHWPTVRRITFPGALGAFVGAVALGQVSTAAAKPWTATLLFALGLYVLFRFMLGGVRRAGEQASAAPARTLAPLGLFAGFVDATGGGGWGPIATPALLLNGRLLPRYVVGSVSASEFLVALAATAGFLVSLGREGLVLPVVAALLLSGLLAAPLAALLVRRLAPRVLGTAVGGLLAITNARTLFAEFGIAGLPRTVAYCLLFVAWAAAVGYAVIAERRHAAVEAEPALR